MRKTELFFDSIADDFLERMNQFDQQTRVNWFERALSTQPVARSTMVDVGAGLGHFSSVGERHGAVVVPIDIAPRLVSRLREKFPAAMVASATDLPFATGSVDFVVSSECIEHTRDPRRAVREMLRVLRPGGVLFLTTPNLLWRWSVGLAELLRIRRFEGIENWLSRPAVRRTIVESGGEIIGTAGLHILPFQLTPLLPVIRLINDRGQWLKPLMINQCWIARKRLTA
jgi:2-polyprenyl-6-hydroxyphenyl methylase/3-demethylubiquinone-9 3-methyltransferase